MGRHHILCGNKSGDIYELVLKHDNDYVTNVVASDMIILKLSAHDGEYVCSMQFSNDNFRLFTITESGLFSVWDLSLLKRVYTNHFNRITVNMVICKATEKIYIAFKDEVIVLRKELGYPAYDDLR